MVSSSSLRHQKGERTAQLILIPYAISTALAQAGGEGSFVSTGQPQIWWMHKTAPQQPLRTVKLKNKKFTEVLDTGADVSIISLQEQPRDRPLSPCSGCSHWCRRHRDSTAGCKYACTGEVLRVEWLLSSLSSSLFHALLGRDVLSQWKIHTTAWVSNLRHGV